MKLFAALLILFTAFYTDRVIAQASGCPPTNIGFEKGDFTGWSCDTGSIAMNGSINVKSSGPVNDRHTLISSGYTPVLDPFGKFPTLCPFGGKYSVRLGNEKTGAGAERMSYTFTVPAGGGAYDLTFYYAVVFQNPSHVSYQQPRFTVKTYDVDDNTYIGCASFDFIAGPQIPLFRKAPVIALQDTQVFYKDWSRSTIHMVGLGGKQVRLEFTTNDCALGGHFGYAYVDVEESCDAPITGNSYCTGQKSITLIAPGGFLDYQWYSGNLSKQLSANQQMTISPPPPDGTKYAVVIYPYPGLGCTDTLYTVVNKNNANFNFKVVDTLFACAGGTVDLTASSVTAGSDKDLQFTYSPDQLGQGYIYKPQSIDTSGTYYVKAINPDGCENILPVQVVIANPTIKITDPPAVYFPATVDLSTAFKPATGSSYKYFKDNIAKIPVTDYQHVALSGTYYVQVTNSHGCQAIAPIVVVIKPPEAIEPGPLTGTIVSCSGTASANPYLQQFSVGGYGVTADIIATAPPGFEISIDPNTGFGDAVTLPQSGGIVNTTIVYLRSSTTAKAGKVSGNVILSSAGQTSKNVGVTATIAQSPSVNQIANQKVTSGTQTTAINFSGTGNTYTWTNDTPGIGLAASGTGAIAPFTAINNGANPVVANITVTPSSFGYAYIANFGSDNVSAISTETGQVSATIPVGSKPVGVVISPDQSLVYITNNGSNTVSVIDAKIGSVNATVNVGQGPLGISISPDGSRVYVVNSGDNTVSVINTQSNTVIAKITVGLGPSGIAISPDGKTLYVANNISSSISFISTVSNTVTSSISLTGSVNALAVSPDGSTLYASLSSANSVAVISTAKSNVTANIPVGSGPYGVAVSPDGSAVYVVNKASSTVSVIDAASNIVSKTITVGSNPIGVSVTPDDTKVYVTNQISNSVSVISLSTQAVTSTINVGTSPESFGAFISTGTGCSGVPQTFTITVTPTTLPTIVYSGTLQPLSTTYGTPSRAENFTVSAKSLTAGILTTAPNGFEVSTDNIKFGNTLTVGTGGTINPANIYVRLAAATPVGTYAGGIGLSSKGAQTVNVPIPNSFVNPAPLVITADDKTRLFEQPNPPLTASYTGFVNKETSSVLSTTPLITTTALTGSVPGQYPITAAGAVAPNYTISYLPGIFTIIPPGQSLVIPNTFTPNGDGINDKWDIKYLETYLNCTISVFTRYGQKVYTSLGYSVPWDGTYNGKPLPSGTYYYIIDLKNNLPVLSGFVTIIR